MAIETSCNNMMSGLKDNTVDDNNTMHHLEKRNEETTHFPTKVTDDDRAMYYFGLYYSHIDMVGYDNMKKYHDMAIEQGSMMYSFDSMINNCKKRSKIIRHKQ